MKHTFTIFLLLLMISFAKHGYAQHSSYQRLALDVSGARSVLQNSFTNNWQSSTALHLGTRLNYHAGNFEAGMRYANYTSQNPDFPKADFSAFFIYIGWEYPFALADGLSLAPGLRFGNTFLSFDNPKTYPPVSGWNKYPFDPNESEFAYELFLRLEYTVAQSPWSIHSSFAYNRTLTYHPLPVGLISLGISRSFDTPSWLKDFLK